MQHRIQRRQLMNVHVRVLAGQLGEEKFRQGQLHKQVLVQCLAQNAPDKVVMSLIILYNLTNARIRVQHVVLGDPECHNKTTGSNLLGTKMTTAKDSHEEAPVRVERGLEQLRQKLAKHSAAVDAGLAHTGRVDHLDAELGAEVGFCKGK